MTKLILTDVDETILQWSDPFQAWLAAAKGISPPGRLRNMNQIEKWLGISTNEAVDLMLEFVETPILRTQPPEECALDTLPGLARDGYQFVAITACGIDPDFKRRRWVTLEATFGVVFENVHVVELGGSKTEFLRQYDNAIWVEDNFSHAVDGAEIGHRSFLINRAYNEDQHHPKVTRVSCWRELAEHLRGTA